MRGYVYIRYDCQEWRQLKKRLESNDGFDGLIECVALKYFNDKTHIGKAKRMIVADANNLLKLRKNFENITDEDLKVYHRVSLKQISSLRRPKSGYTTCYAGIILMAIINLLCDGGGNNVNQSIQNLCEETDVDFLTFALKEQYNSILHAYNNRRGEFANINSHQYKLARYYSTACHRFNQRFEGTTYDCVTRHLDAQHVFNYQDSVPSYRDHDFVR